ncbi:MAG TPA: DNA-directed RNA polymerase subunit beta, partial [Rhodospirillales bacterium]|nr:DNA-directed RNA polymerase subunit beta [Rhodospirillales bacterium]
MHMSFTGRKRVRKNFGRLSAAVPMPNLIEVQKTSYDQFLQVKSSAEERENSGMQAVFKSVFPIKDFAERGTLEFVSYNFEQPKYDVDECQQRGMTYAAPLKVTLRLVVWDIDEETGARSIRDIKEQDVFMGDMPLMTLNGTFVINGTERVIVSQMHRSPGVFFDHDKGKTHSSGKFLFAARVIPYRGSWLDFEFDAKDLVYVRIDRRRKLPVTTLLMALDSEKTVKLRAKREKEGKEVGLDEVTGMSPVDILDYFYGKVAFTRVKKGWKTDFNPASFRGIKLTSDIINAKTGKVVVEAGAKMTAHLIRDLDGKGIKEQLVSEEDLIGRYMATDLVNDKTGVIYAEAGDEITEAILGELEEAGIDGLVTLAIDHINVGPYIRNTLAVDKNTARAEALIDIYRVMRPG